MRAPVPVAWSQQAVHLTETGSGQATRHVVHWPSIRSGDLVIEGVQLRPFEEAKHQDAAGIEHSADLLERKGYLRNRRPDLDHRPRRAVPQRNTDILICRAMIGSRHGYRWYPGRCGADSSASPPAATLTIRATHDQGN